MHAKPVSVVRPVSPFCATGMLNKQRDGLTHHQCNTQSKHWVVYCGNNIKNRSKPKMYLQCCSMCWWVVRCGHEAHHKSISAHHNLHDTTSCQPILKREPHPGQVTLQSIRLDEECMSREGRAVSGGALSMCSRLPCAAVPKFTSAAALGSRACLA